MAYVGGERRYAAVVLYLCAVLKDPVSFPQKCCSSCTASAIGHDIAAWLPLIVFAVSLSFSSSPRDYALFFSRTVAFSILTLVVR
jgi:hypothetical protein